MPIREELVRRAASLVPILRERAAKTEQRRQIPPETIEDLKAAQLITVAQPQSCGRMGLDFDVVFDIAAELGRGCGSTAWCYGIWASHNWLVALFPEKAQKEYWSEDPCTLASTSFNAARGNATVAPGGYRLSGHWDFSSGCDPAQWVLLIANGPETPMMLLLPLQDYTIKDTWFVSGLKGTGSKDILVDDVFVPEHRSVPMPLLREGNAPGRQVHNTANQRIPMQSILPYTLASPIIGMARGAVETFEERISHGASGREGNPLSQIASYHLRLAESAAEVDAAQLIMRRDCREIMKRAHRDELPSIDDRARYRRDHAYVTWLCVRAIDRLFEASGGHSLYDSSPMQRFHRDAHAASHHVGLNWDILAEQYGRVRAGLEPDPRLV